MNTFNHDEATPMNEDVFSKSNEPSLGGHFLGYP